MSRPMRVLWFTKGLGLGGAERLIASSLRHLDRTQVEVEVAYLLPHKEALVGDIAASGVPVWCLGSRRRIDAAWPLRLRSLVRERSYDIVHTHMPMSAAVARLTVGRRARFVHTEHNVWERHRLPSRWANAVTLNRNAAILAVSDSVAATIRPPRLPAVRPTDVEVLLHGINFDDIVDRDDVDARGRARATLGLGATDAVVGSVANFTPKKDQAMLLRAVADLAHRLPAIRLVLIGSGPLEGELRSLALGLGLGDRVVFAGSRPDVPELLPALDVFCLSSRFEGLSIALVEAMAAGVPCVATEVGGIPEVIEDQVTGLLVPAGSAASLSRSLERVLTDAQFARQLATSGRVRAEAFDIGRAARRLQSLYAEVLSA